MSEPKAKYVPVQRIVGMQVVDLKGAVVGNVKDVSVNVEDRDLGLVVTTRARTEVNVPLDDVKSIEDVVLLAKSIDIPKPETMAPAAGPLTVTVPPPGMIACPTCGTNVPSHAKFCPKCGSKLK
jgi:sporulation protein YlmC with PRC-barrel domain